MSFEISTNQAGHDHQPKEIIIKIKLEEIFQENQCHPEPEEGTIIYYIIKVDKKEFEVKQSSLTGREILGLVGYTPEKYSLFEIGEGQKEIAPNEHVDFKKPGIERFKSVAKEANEGSGVSPLPSSLRREINLLQEDVQFLDRLKLKWETIRAQQTGWILIHDFRIPDGYHISRSTLALMIPPSYPTVEFDMAYFYPPVHRQDGKVIGQITQQALDGVSYQRWSRHRNPGTWRPGIDNLESHVLSVTKWMEAEFSKR
jgi:Prokaryotic E2 family E/Multiubiquitin